MLPPYYCLPTTASLLLPTYYCLPTTAYLLLPTYYCLPTAASLLLPPYYCLPTTAYLLLPTYYCLPTTGPKVCWRGPEPQGTPNHTFLAPIGSPSNRFAYPERGSMQNFGADLAR